MKNQTYTTKINSKGHLEIDQIDCVELAKKFGTPLYVIDEYDLRHRCRKYLSAFKKYPKTKIVYASKALSNIAVLRTVASEGLGADVVSGGELFTALKAKVKPGLLYFHGNNKSESELKDAINKGINIVVDNFREIDQISKLSKKINKRIKVLIRINPGVEAHTHEFIQTGKIDSKFGIAKKDVLIAVEKLINISKVDFLGLHAHIGSQIFKIKPFELEINVLASLAGEIKRSLNVEIKELNIGGGIGIPYLDTDNLPAIKEFADIIIKSFKTSCQKENLNNPYLVIEPGRSIIGLSGVTLYTVGNIKDIAGIRKYVMVDGGMSDNSRPILYGAKYDFIIANKANQDKKELVTIAGRFCESGDILGKDVKIQKVEPGDILAVFCTGAYNYSMSSNYNRVTRPAMIMIKKGKARVVVKRETYQDLIRLDKA